MVMIKDNHISVAGGVTNAIRLVDIFLERENLQMPVEVQTIVIYLFIWNLMHNCI